MNESMPTALLVEDDHEIRRFVRAALEHDGWQVREAASLARARIDAWSGQPDRIVLDLGLPGGGGVDYIVQVRQRSRVPIIVLAARVDDSEKMRALNAGADDYLSKLFGIGARFNAALRRLRPRPPQLYGECE